MANDGSDTSRRGERRDFGKLYSFADVFNKEIEIINQRRRGPTAEIEVEEIDVEVDRRTGEATIRIEERHGTVAVGDPDRPLQSQITLEPEGEDVTRQTVWRPNQDANVVGLALSGGGIRSAAVCLGVLQALDVTKVLPKVDYLSTVSGGGYIGCSLTAALQAGAEQDCPGFPFTSALHEDEPAPLQHVRDYSNYLFPHRSSSIDLLRNAAIYARGLVVNAVILIPFLFGAAAITLLYYAARHTFTSPRVYGVSIANPFGFRHFFISFDILLVLLVISVVWGIFQSTRKQQLKTEIPGWPSVSVSSLITLFLFLVFCELQPFILDSMRGASGGWGGMLNKWITTVSAILAPISAAFAYLSSKLGEYLKSAMQSPSAKAQTKGVAVKVGIIVGGLILPVLLWMLYLDVSYWGLCIDIGGKCADRVPSWLKDAALAFSVAEGHSADVLFAVTALVFFGLTLAMQPNANSLHPLYRDRLSKAFLFRPWLKAQPQQRASMPVPWPVDTKKPDLVAEWRPKLSDITGKDGPYHLINTALNVEGSTVANRRGRNADFFMFSPKFVGSKSTGYVCTTDIEKIATGLTLATAMAASGAAVSSNMGAETIKPLTATLALLNVRLGYWLRNPARLKEYAEQPACLNLIGKFRRHHNIIANYYFLLEVFGRLNEKKKSVYLTDGGHIDNTGIYELLRRRCKVIIAVDAEADPQMAFGSFNTLERYALIDLGIRIDLPWQPIADRSLVTSQEIDNAGALTGGGEGASNEKVSQVPKDHGPHCAIGEITYPNNRKGILIYIKASLSGDENDYIFDYKKRYSAFPHETTLDQMFTEEQFECYRALGFHAAFRLFDRDDDFAHLHPRDNPGVLEEIQLLDRLFPRRDPSGDDPLDQKTTFAEWVAPNSAPTKATPTSHS